MSPCCFICGRSPSPPSAAKRQLNCPGCARNNIYKYRIEYAQVLLEKDALSKQIDKITQDGEQDDALARFVAAGTTASASEQEKATLSFASNVAAVKAGESRARTATIRGGIDQLKTEIEASRATLAKQKDEIARRKSDLETASYEKYERHQKSLSKLGSDIQKTKTSWDRYHATLGESKYYLAQELAREVVRLRRHESGTNDGKAIYSYSLGGIEIINLRDLYGIENDRLNASFSTVARFVCLVAHYLALRLPAEICLPSAGNPLPSIVPPTYSYRSNRQGIHMKKSRSRPLSIAKAISRLAREDPVASTSFLEGVSLLAWDIAWLVRTQGIRQGTEKWEDVCDIGHNLYRLLIAPPAPVLSDTTNRPAAATAAKPSSAPPSSSRKSADSSASKSQSRSTNNLPALGKYSHGSAHSFLCSVAGTEFMGNWKYSGPARFVEKVKGAMINEIHSAEWELLEGRDWSHDNEGEVENDQNKDSESGAGESLDQTVIL